jgi:hypothetical protein
MLPAKHRYAVAQDLQHPILLDHHIAKQQVESLGH